MHFMLPYMLHLQKYAIRLYVFTRAYVSMHLNTQGYVCIFFFFFNAFR